MQLTNPVIVVGIFFLVLFFVALSVGLVVQRRRSVTNAGSTDAPDWAKSSAGTPSIGGERMASPISEAIEDMVRERMAADPTLQGVLIDFGSTDDGGLEIWVDEERFTSVDDIRNDRIKAIIQEAVTAYNEGAL